MSNTVGIIHSDLDQVKPYIDFLSSCSEHIALYLVKGKVMLKVKFAHETQRIKTDEKFNNGNWNLIAFQRKGNTLQLRVDGDLYFSEISEYSQTFSDLLFFYIGGLQVTVSIGLSCYKCSISRT